MTTETQYDLSKYRYYNPEEFGVDRVPQSNPHDVTIRFICLIVEWLFRQQHLVTSTNMEFRFPDPAMPPISPDVALLKKSDISNMTGNRTVYYVGTTGPAPAVVFEVASGSTWPTDLEEKPEAYAQLGVQEYFVIDPNPRGIWTRHWKSKNRLIGWRTDANGQPVEIAKDARGRLWSEQLQSWLAMDGSELRFYDTQNNLRLTGEEAERLQKEAYAAKLRELGIDPDTLV